MSADTKYSSQATLSSQKGGILVLSPLRSGTHSLAHALRILGHERILHAVENILDNNEWAGYFRASWACSQYLRESGYRPAWAKNMALTHPWTVEDWDALFGDYQGLTDSAAMFAPELVQVYPNAKFIVCHRDLDAWEASFDRALIRCFHQGWVGWLFREWVSPLAGIWLMQAQWGCLIGWTRAQTTDGMRNNLRKRYDEHFAEIRRLVPKEQLLEFKLGDGWGPLCEFLNCPIPDVPYPHMNSSKDIDKARNGFYVFCLLKASWNLAKWPMAIGVGCLAVKMAGVDVGSVFSEWW